MPHVRRRALTYTTGGVGEAHLDERSKSIRSVVERLSETGR
jgi:hypothetical protein